MQEDYYQNILYPFQDKVLHAIQDLNSDFYLTGGTALSRAYLHHRHSDDLDFFVNANPAFKEQAEGIINTLMKNGFQVETALADVSFVRMFIHAGSDTLKIDLVNDVAYRNGKPQPTALFHKTDTMRNILSNKLTALSRLSVKDLVDIVFISNSLDFDWQDVFYDATQKDLWVNPVEVCKILDGFPVADLDQIIWVSPGPPVNLFNSALKQIIGDIIEGRRNRPGISDFNID